MATLIVRRGEAGPNLMKFSGAVEFEEHQLRVEVDAGDQLHAYMLDDVLIAGRTVTLYSFSTVPASREEQFDAFRASDARPRIKQLLGELTAPALRGYLLEIERRHRMGEETYHWMDGADGQRLLRQRVSAMKVFSLLALPRLKPLTEIPPADKWTLAHAKRALANGQFKDLQCDGVYTDDYARDAERDYERGPLTLEALLPQVISSGATSGWRTAIHIPSRKVVVNQHSFDRNSFELVL